MWDHATAILRAQALVMAGAKPWAGVVEDFSDMVEKRGATVVHAFVRVNQMGVGEEPNICFLTAYGWITVRMTWF